jgi:hypothetical protein
VLDPRRSRDADWIKVALSGGLSRSLSRIADDFLFTTSPQRRTERTSVFEASDAGQKSMEHLFGAVLSCSAREDELRLEMLKAGVKLSGSERIRLEMDEAAASYDSRKATKVFEHIAKNRTWQVPTLDVVVPYAYSFDARVTTDPRLKYIPASVQQRWSDEAKSSTDGAIKARTFKQRSQIVGAMHRAGVPCWPGRMWRGTSPIPMLDSRYTTNSLY